MAYVTISKTNKTETEIDRSVFICQSFYVETEENVKEILQTVKSKYYDATHNCYAYKLLDGKQKSSDDKEPSGTAGAPILEAINYSELKNVLVVVTRYFGGVKLGAGGLTRAYFNSAKQNLDTVEKIKYELCSVYKMTLSYEQYNAISQIITTLASVKEKEFSDNVTLTVAVTKQNFCLLKTQLCQKLNKEQELIFIKESYEVCP